MFSAIFDRKFFMHWHVETKATESCNHSRTYLKKKEQKGNSNNSLKKQSTCSSFIIEIKCY